MAERKSRAAGLLLRDLDGTATVEERAELREIVAEFAASAPGGRSERDRMTMAEEIVQLVVKSDAGLSQAEIAEVRHLFYSTHDPYLTLGVIRKIAAAIKSGKK